MMKIVGLPVRFAVPVLLLLGCDTACAASAAGSPSVGGIPVDFLLFGLTLLGVALFHRHTLRVALTGVATITLYKLIFTGFNPGPGVAGLVEHCSRPGFTSATSPPSSPRPTQAVPAAWWVTLQPP